MRGSQVVRAGRTFISAAIACLMGSVLVAAGVPPPTQAASSTAGTAGALTSGVTSRLSVGPGGVQANGDSFFHSESSDGRYAAFYSVASNLVAGDTNGTADVFVRDLATGVNELVSLGPNGVQGNSDSFGTAISADGRYVAFSSNATNLVPGDTNAVADVFVRDRLTGSTERVSVGPGGLEGDDASFVTSISGSGRYVGFDTSATNLVTGDTNLQSDAFVRDRVAGTTELVSAAPSGASGNDFSFGPMISADGTQVAFYSAASNLTPGDTNGVEDVFIWDRVSGTLTRVTTGLNGAQADGASVEPSLTKHGRYVAYASRATNLVAGDTNGAIDVFVFDQLTGTTQEISVGRRGLPGRLDSDQPAISAKGTYIAFRSFAPNLVLGDTNRRGDIFVANRVTHRVRRVSLGTGGIQSNDTSFAPTISPGGQRVIFETTASNLVPGDTNGHWDVFAWHR